MSPMDDFIWKSSADHHDGRAARPHSSCHARMGVHARRNGRPAHATSLCRGRHAVSARDQGGVIVPATINGAGPFRMLLDTGATHSAITERSPPPPVRGRSRKAGRFARRRHGAGNCEHRSARRRPDRHRTGCRPWCHAMRSAPACTASSGRTCWPSGATRWTSGAARCGGTTERRRRRRAVEPLIRERPVPGRAAQQSATLRLVPDSGAGSLVLFDAPRAAPPSSTVSDGRAQNGRGRRQCPARPPPRAPGR